MRVDDFDFHLPPDRIALRPASPRDSARLLVVHADGTLSHKYVRDLPSLLHGGDALVVNDTRVFAARLKGTRTARAPGAANAGIEVTLYKRTAPDSFLALARGARKLKRGDAIRFGETLTAGVVARGDGGEVALRFFFQGSALDSEIARLGEMPLPPYIAGKRKPDARDRDDYQTIFAREPCSAAAPTAGLHFTPEVLDRCRAAGADIASVTLHVGLGTFQPLHQRHVEEVKLHSEHYRISPEAAAQIDRARRVVAVGTTAVRTIETAARTGQSEGETSLFLYPGAGFRKTGAMLTNFHLPGTSLLLLVCAFAGTDLTLAAYRHAVEARYRFYSYGDCMLVV